MRQINLLPSELKPNKNILASLKRVEKYLVITVSFYIIIVTSNIGINYYIKKSISKYSATKVQLSSELKGMATLETKNVYLKDRVAKYSKISDTNTELVTYEFLSKLNQLLPVNTKISGIHISNQKLDFNIQTPSLVNFSDIINYFIATDFKNIDISAISFSPDKGVVFNITMEL